MRKFRNSKGFTLVEMLIVVAIIAILIAIAIPLISATLERAREGVDDANERSAVSLAYAYYLTTPESALEEGESYSSDGAGVVRYFDVNKSAAQNTKNDTINEGGIVKDQPIEAYGKGTEIGDVKEDRTDRVIKLTIKNPVDEVSPVVTAEWVKVGGGAGGGAGGSGD